jgi:hypothetical protein
VADHVPLTVWKAIGGGGCVVVVVGAAVVVVVAGTVVLVVTITVVVVVALVVVEVVGRADDGVVDFAVVLIVGAAVSTVRADDELLPADVVVLSGADVADDELVAPASTAPADDDFLSASFWHAPRIDRAARARTPRRAGDERMKLTSLVPERNVFTRAAATG